MKDLTIGMAVHFWDDRRVKHSALITAVHGEISDKDGNVWIPCVNLVYVSRDEAKQDPYGRQLERQSSVVNRVDMHIEGPPAMCWDWMD